MNSSKLLWLLGISSGLLGLAACASEEEIDEEESTLSAPALKISPPDQISATENFKLWSEYCVGDQEATRKPVPNYENPDVLDAAKSLTRVATHSFALYSSVSKHHRGTLPSELVGTVSEEAHEFMTYLCGEFRDRAKMVAAKTRWVREMNYLPLTSGAYDVKGDPFKQMTVTDYKSYVAFSRGYFSAKKSELSSQGKATMMIGTVSADTPVPAMTVCETKYIMAEYIRKAKPFDNLAALRAGYATFKSNCKSDDENYYYDFRGDSNIKPNSPEANGMIWFSRTMASQCETKTVPYGSPTKSAIISPEECRRYVQHPFSSRWNAARAGLAAWVLVDPMNPGLDSNSTTVMSPRAVDNAKYLFGDLAPYAMRKAASAPTFGVDAGAAPSGELFQFLAGYKDSFSKPSFGVGKLMGSQERLQRTLQLAVDRHTDWYNSGYDDLMPKNSVKNTKAYSPFVASSYEIAASDGFTKPGVTVDSPDPAAGKYKHFMYVFKVKKENWFSPTNIVSNPSGVAEPNFDRVWLDETSFGNTGLANSEKAWDRLGTALEDELDSVLYLRNVDKPADPIGTGSPTPAPSGSGSSSPPPFGSPADAGVGG
ncbi:MAG: hypothetical protein KBF88_05145 [Polyangiaceae bacterium]|nr:hypothetical protein [Polyangiaceae bacterium]